MRRVRELIVDGVLLALPIAAVLFLLVKAIRLVAKVTAPVAELTPPGRLFGIGIADVLAVVGLLLALAALGAFARLRVTRRITTALERSVLHRIPGYMVLKSSLSAYAREGAEDLRPAFVAFDDNTVLGLVVEWSDVADGMVTVFVPGAPTTTSGSVMIVERRRVTLLHGSTAGALRSLSRLGAGLQSLRPAASPRTSEATSPIA
jgi:uncharacterized membrane protein